MIFGRSLLFCPYQAPPGLAVGGHVNFRQKPAGTAASEKLRLLCTCLSASIAVNLRLLADFLSVSQPSNQ